MDTSRASKPSEAGGFFVRAENFSYPGYLKPTKKCPDEHPRASYEKIVADLAVELNLPVPPVLLYRRDDCPEGEEPRACISLVVYQEVLEWGDIMNLGDLKDAVKVIVKSVLARCSGVIALDTYIGNADRNNARNAAFGFNPDSLADASFFFLDHANSLNMGNCWKDGRWGQVNLPGLPEVLSQSVDPNVLGQTVSKIEKLSEETIGGIVERIPDDYLTPEHKSVVLDGLIGRRSLIRKPISEKFF